MVIDFAPRLIFLDAMGTLFSLRKSVGEIYAEQAAHFGMAVDSNALEFQFRQVFQRHHAPVFASTVSQDELIQLEKGWWRTVVLQTFQQALGSMDLTAFDIFFDEIYRYFASAMPWVLFPEVTSVLQQWTDDGVTLGIISNFDSRLFRIIDELQISAFFQSITISSQAGAAKPDAKIFEMALSKHQCAPEFALHVGDQWTDDFQGASLAQLQSIWLDRTDSSSDRTRVSALDKILWK